MSQSKHCRKTILTAASGTGSVDLPVPAGKISNLEVTKGVGSITLEALASSGCRLFVSGGVLDGEVVVEWDQAA